ncbi:MAG TPA: NAD-dependent epimerase/dehydratase family protein [Polyangiaceae bacterium]|nr:NAD-dependent epimerase/dehydratase family protein [Polyangiaceae bacterium]
MATRGKVLVTGAGEFLGARVARQLLDAGERVKAFVSPGEGRRALASLPREGLEVHEGDVRVGHTVYRALAGCDRLVHAASAARPGAGGAGRVAAAAEACAREVLEAARLRGVARVAYASSWLTLGTSGAQEALDEGHAFNLRDPDPRVEAARRAEAVALSYANEKGLPLVVALPAALFGPDDWRPSPLGALVARFLRHRAPFFDFPSAEGGLSVVDVDDAARGLALCLERGRPGERYALGGENLTYEQFFGVLADISGLSGPGPKVGRSLAEWAGRLGASPGAPGEGAGLSYPIARDYVGAYAWASSSKAERELGYSFRPARQALARAVQFFVAAGFVPPADARRIRVDLRAALG